MATEVIGPLSRSSTAVCRSSMQLPVVAHPGSRLGRPGDLQVRGQSRGGSRPSRLTARSAPPPAEDLLPPVSGQGQPLGITRSYTSPELYAALGHRQQGLRQKRWQTLAEEADDDALEVRIRDRMEHSSAGVRMMFRNYDPNGGLTISRQAFLRVLYSLIGFITTGQYKRLLKRLGLADADVIHYDRFMENFVPTSQTHAEWLNPVQPLHPLEKVFLPEGHLRDATWLEEVSRRGSDEAAKSSAFCLQLLREDARKPSFNILQLLPESCFKEGVVVAPQLRDMLNTLNHKISDDDFIKLWERFDLQATGAVKLSAFLNKLGITPNRPAGRQSPQTTQKTVAKLENETKPMSEDIKEKTSLRKIKKTLIKPKLDSAMDCLHYKFEEHYSAMLAGFQCFDFLSDGFISRIDMKHVLEEFGFPIASTDLEYFLSRCGVRNVGGQVPYRELMLKFWNRSESGITHRVVSNKLHLFHDRQLPRTPGQGESMTVEELEAKLIEYLQGDFLKLVGLLRARDVHNLGCIQPHAFRSSIEQVLGYTITNEQWMKMKVNVTTDESDLIDFNAFLEEFKSSPGYWNRKEHIGVVIPKIGPPPTPDVVLALRRKRRTELDVIAGKSHKPGMEYTGRDINELNKVMYDVFRIKFHSFDKFFKEMDRKQTGRMDKNLFTELLQKVKVEVTVAEIDCLWESFDIGADGMTSYTGLVRQLTERRNITEASPTPRGQYIDDKVQRSYDVFKQQQKQKVIPEEEDENKPGNLESPKNTKEELLALAKPNVIRQWESLKTVFRELDRDGTAVVPARKVMDALQTIDLNLSAAQLQCLMVYFDSNKDGNFHYIDFLEMYTRKQNACKSRPLVYDKGTHRLRRRLVDNYKSIRRAFKKADSNAKGYLTVEDFKDVLRTCGIEVLEEDHYYIISEFDSDLTGTISYQQFLTQLTTPCN